jgi:hypothetical protein
LQMLLARLAEFLTRWHDMRLVYTAPPQTPSSPRTCATRSCGSSTPETSRRQKPGRSRLLHAQPWRSRVRPQPSALNTLIDVQALAVLVYQMLSLVHPLRGDAVDAGEPELQESGPLPGTRRSPGWFTTRFAATRLRGAFRESWCSPPRCAS